jgi:hypothetical protein
VKRGADFAFGSPGSDGAAFVEAGLEFVVRYVPYTGDGGKGLKAVEVEDFHSHGVAICLVWETTAGRALDGYNAGAVDAQYARQSARSMGFPDDRPIYYAIDTDINSSLYDEVVSYFHGVSDVEGPGLTGAYGEYEAMVLLQNSGYVKWFWQCLAWSAGRDFPDRHMYQYTPGTPFNGHLVDYDYAYGDDYGQWPVEETIDMKELEDTLIAEYSGSEEANLTREERLTNARYRRDEIVAGRAQSINDRASSAIALSQRALAIVVAVSAAVGGAGAILVNVAK